MNWTTKSKVELREGVSNELVEWGGWAMRRRPLSRQWWVEICNISSGLLTQKRHGESTICKSQKTRKSLSIWSATTPILRAHFPRALLRIAFVRILTQFSTQVSPYYYRRTFLLALRIILLSLHKGKFPGSWHAAAVCVCLPACASACFA
jgi:hypothetical protein